MKLLALDSSSITASVCLMENNKILSEFSLNAGLTHSQTLAPMIQASLNILNLKVSNIDLLAITEGPGSFTGLRIGLATIKGIGVVFNKPCIGVSSLVAAAYNCINFNGIICAVMDARRNQFYNAIFKCQNKKLTRLTKDRIISLEELEKELKNFSECVELIGDGAVICYNNINKGKNESNIKFSFEGSHYVKASSVGILGLELYKQGSFSDASNLNPKYLRLSQAERMLIENKLKA